MPEHQHRAAKGEVSHLDLIQEGDFSLNVTYLSKRERLYTEPLGKHTPHRFSSCKEEWLDKADHSTCSTSRNGTRWNLNHWWVAETFTTNGFSANRSNCRSYPS
jgi:hypothetical protein